MKAIWEDTVVADSDKTIVIEGNHYFPPNSIKTEHFLPSDTQSTCHWKGTANYYHVQENAFVVVNAGGDFYKLNRYHGVIRLTKRPLEIYLLHRK